MPNTPTTAASRAVRQVNKRIPHPVMLRLAGSQLPERRRRVFDLFRIQRFVKFDVRTDATDNSPRTE